MKLVDNEILKDVIKILNSDMYTDEDKQKFLFYLVSIGEYFLPE